MSDLALIHVNEDDDDMHREGGEGYENATRE
jgi:hypothetical protein